MTAKSLLPKALVEPTTTTLPSGAIATAFAVSVAPKLMSEVPPVPKVVSRVPVAAIAGIAVVKRAARSTAIGFLVGFMMWDRFCRWCSSRTDSKLESEGTGSIPGEFWIENKKELERVSSHSCGR